MAASIWSEADYASAAERDPGGSCVKSCRREGGSLWVVMMEK